MSIDEATRNRQRAEDAAAAKAIDAEVRSILEPDCKVYSLTVNPHRVQGYYEAIVRFTVGMEKAKGLVNE